MMHFRNGDKLNRIIRATGAVYIVYGDGFGVTVLGFRALISPHWMGLAPIHRHSGHHVHNLAPT